MHFQIVGTGVLDCPKTNDYNLHKMAILTPFRRDETPYTDGRGRPSLQFFVLCEQGAPRRSDRAAIALRRLRLGFRLRNRCAISPLKMTRGGWAT